MSIGVSVRTTKFAARNNSIGVRQVSNPQSPTAYSSVRYDTIGYFVDFTYNERFDKLCWVFKFPTLNVLERDGKENKKGYNVMEIDWKTPQIIGEYKSEEWTQR